MLLLILYVFLVFVERKHQESQQHNSVQDISLNNGVTMNLQITGASVLSSTSQEAYNELGKLSITEGLHRQQQDENSVSNDLHPSQVHSLSSSSIPILANSVLSKPSLQNQAKVLEQPHLSHGIDETYIEKGSELQEPLASNLEDEACNVISDFEPRNYDPDLKEMMQLPRNGKRMASNLSQGQLTENILLNGEVLEEPLPIPSNLAKDEQLVSTKILYQNRNLQPGIPEDPDSGVEFQLADPGLSRQGQQSTVSGPTAQSQRSHSAPRSRSVASQGSSGMQNNEQDRGELWSPTAGPAAQHPLLERNPSSGLNNVHRSSVYQQHGNTSWQQNGSTSWGGNHSLQSHQTSASSGFSNGRHRGKQGGRVANVGGNVGRGSLGGGGHYSNNGGRQGLPSRGSSPALPLYRDVPYESNRTAINDGSTDIPEPASTSDLDRFILQVWILSL